jgi:hypothetical protein
MSAARRAIIVGINKYKDEAMNLQGAVHDAEDIRNILSRYGPFTIDDKHFLTDERATMEAIREAISDLFWDTGEGEIALFYFSGHGYRDHYNYVYLLPHDADKRAAFARGIRIQELKDLFIRAEPKNKHGIMILDCCYSGEATKGGDLQDSEHVHLHEQLSDIEASGTGRFIISSAGADKLSREVKKGHAFSEGYEVGQGEHWHGAFTFHLIEGLCSGAQDHMGQVSLESLKKHFEGFKAQGDQRPKFYMGDATAERVFLTTISQQLNDHRREIEDLINKGMCDNPHSSEDCLRSLFRAIDMLDILEAGAGIRRDEMTDYVCEIQKIMSVSKGPLFKWWFDNNRQMFVTNQRRFTELEHVFTTLDMSYVRKLDNTGRGLALQVMLLIKNGGSAKKVEEWINLLDDDAQIVSAGTLTPPASSRLLPNLR